MDIMELGAIGELIGGVAVIATLIYLARQIRQGTTATQGAAERELLEGVQEAAFSRDIPRLTHQHVAGVVDRDGCAEARSYARRSTRHDSGYHDASRRR